MAQSYSTNEDVTLIVAGPGVLPNDTDIDSVTLTASLVGNAAHGVVTLNADGGFTYDPHEDYNGPDSFTYRAFDGSDYGNTVAVTFTVNPVNDAPQVDAGNDNTVLEGLVSFSGSATDVDGDSLSYAWNFSDGQTATGAPTNRVFTDNGIYTATLTVSDGKGGVGTDTLTVVVNNAPPALSNVVVTPTSLNEGQAATLSGTISDPGTADTFTLTVDWGDGSGLESFEYGAGTTSLNQSHQYLDNASSINLTIKDDDNGVGTASRSITVSNVNPEILGLSLGSASIDENGSVTLNGTLRDVGTQDAHTLRAQLGRSAFSQ